MARCPYTFGELDPEDTETREKMALPGGWDDAVVHCVAMAGARGSGKSLFIAVMIKQLEQWARREVSEGNVGVKFVPINQEVSERYRKLYENPLFAELRLLPSTPTNETGGPTSKPLIYSLGSWGPEGKERKHYLVIRDVAGEELQNVRMDNEFEPEKLESAATKIESLAFFRSADLVIFLCDPMKVPSIRTYLEGRISTPLDPGHNPEDVLNKLLFVLGDSRPPLAMAISKFDYLPLLGEVEIAGQWNAIMNNYGAAFRRDSGLAYEEDSSVLLDLEVKSILHLMEANTLLAIVQENFVDCRFFAVSALGRPAGTKDVDPRGIAPYRCLDPFLWMIDRYNKQTAEKQLSQTPPKEGKAQTPAPKRGFFSRIFGFLRS